jgi:hypothetical protein
MHPKQYLSPWYVWRKPCTYLALILTLSPTNQNEIPHDPRHLGVPSGGTKMISEPVVCSTQIIHLSSLKISNISK